MSRSSRLNISDVQARWLSLKPVLNQDLHNPTILFTNCFHFFHNSNVVSDIWYAEGRRARCGTSPEIAHSNSRHLGCRWSSLRLAPFLPNDPSSCRARRIEFNNADHRWRLAEHLTVRAPIPGEVERIDLNLGFMSGPHEANVAAAAITWAEGCRGRIDGRSSAGRRFVATSIKSERTAGREIRFAGRGNGRFCCTGPNRTRNRLLPAARPAERMRARCAW